MKIDAHVVTVCLLGALLGALLSVSGCREKAAPAVPPAAVAAARDGSRAPAPAAPPAAGGKEAGTSRVDSFLNMAKDTLNASSAENVGNYYVSGLTLLLLALGVFGVSGSWKAAAVTVALGAGLGAVGVLLENYARVVLLIPLCGLCMFVAHAARKVTEWRTGYNAFAAAATTFEEADRGPNSNGKKAKALLAGSAAADIVEQALEPLRKAWENDSSHTAG